MTIHSSLRGVDNLKGERSVLTRMERIRKLQKDGKIDPESDSPHGLPKVRTKFKIKVRRKASAETEETPAESPEASEASAE